MRWRSIAAALAAIVFSSTAHAAPTAPAAPSTKAPHAAHPTPKAPYRPAPPPPIPLPALPILARVTVDVTEPEGRVLVVHDFVLERGEYKSGDLSLYVAYGAPGVPLALDAQVLPHGSPGATTLPPLTAPGDAAIVETRARKPDRIDWVVGRDAQAGALVRVPAALLSKTWANGDALVLRVRAVHQTPHDARDVLVRMGTVGKQTTTVQRIEVRGNLRASVHTCRHGDAGAPVIAYDADSGRRLDASDARDAVTYYVRTTADQMQRAPDDDLCVALP